MLRLTCTLLVFIFSFNNLFAQSELLAFNIADSLKKDADAVIRYDLTEFIILSEQKTQLKKKIIVTIFNEAGENKLGYMKVDYDKYTKIIDFEGTVYDKFGKVQKKLKNTDILDINLNAFGQFIEDGRSKIAQFNKKAYEFPYTIEFAYEEENKNTLFFPSWRPYSNEKVAVEKSIFRIKHPTNHSFRKKEWFIKNPAITTIIKDEIITEYEVKNLISKSAENYIGIPQSPVVQTAPSYYHWEDYSGKFDSWNDLATFYTKVNTGRNTLPQSEIQKVQEIIKPFTKTQDKIAAIYKFMQQKTRYFNISLGMGGWQTLPASLVAEKGYGDCKALTNYTIALLGVAGIKAYPALIYAGDEDNPYFDAGFPIANFNHVLACVPMPETKDTLWLECTSQTNPINYQGSFTGNRQALFINGTVGKIIKTQKYLPEDNQRNRKITMKVAENGNAKLQLESQYKGILHERVLGNLENRNQEEQKLWIVEKLSLPNLELLDWKFEKNLISKPEITEKLQIDINKFASISGNRMFVKTSPISKFQPENEINNNREEPFYLNPNSYHFTHNDQIEIEIPIGYSIEFLPKPIKIHHSFGSFEFDISVESNVIKATRKLVVIAGSYAPLENANWLDFIKAIGKSDNQKAVFVKK